MTSSYRQEQRVGEGNRAGADQSDAEIAALWNKLVGPFFDTAGVEEIFAGEVPSWILIVETVDGAKLYPTFQFSEPGVLLPHLAEVLEILHPVCDGWTEALWLTAPLRDFDGRTIAQLLIEGEFETVILQARRDAGVWSH